MTNNISIMGEDTQNPTRVPPSKVEKLQYYRGLPTEPLLVARFSSFCWEIPTQEAGTFSTIMRKRLHSIGDHPIYNKWYEIVNKIQKVVKHTSCYAIDIAEVRYSLMDDYEPVHSASEEQMQNRVTVLLSVEPQSLRWDQANSLVYQCQDILNSYNMHDVSCEIKENSGVKFTKQRDDKRPKDCQLPGTTGQNFKIFSSDVEYPRLREYNMLEKAAFYQLSDSLSTPIGLHKVGNAVGVKGLYLRPRSTAKGEKNVIYALTTRNLLVSEETEPPIIPSEQEYRYEVGKEKLEVFQCNNSPLERDLSDAKRHEKDCSKTAKSCLSAVISEGGHPGDNKEHTEGRQYASSATLKRWEVAKERLAKYQALALQFEEILEAGKPGRTIGHVEYVAPRESSPWCVDWALVELNPNCHERDFKEFKNDIQFTKHGFYSSPYCETVAASFIAAREWGRQGSIRLKEEIVPESELEPLPKDSSPLLVAKVGSMADLSFGEASRLRSLVRAPGNDKGWAFQWPIYAAPGPEFADFSNDNDSGCCVFDLTGRVVGIVCGGARRRDGMYNASHDVTYFTPMGRLLSLVTKAGFDLELV